MERSRRLSLGQSPAKPHYLYPPANAVGYKPKKLQGLDSIRMSQISKRNVVTRNGSGAKIAKGLDAYQKVRSESRISRIPRITRIEKRNNLPFNQALKGRHIPARRCSPSQKQLPFNPALKGRHILARRYSPSRKQLHFNPKSCKSCNPENLDSDNKAWSESGFARF
jgi:hypothetical protein